MYVGNIQKMKYFAGRAFKYDLEDAINIPKLKYVSVSYMKDKWYFNRTSPIDPWTKVDMAIVKDY